MIVVRFQRGNGPTAVLRIEDDSKLQRVMDICNRHFGNPLRVLPDPFVAIAQAKERRKRGGKNRGKN